MKPLATALCVWALCAPALPEETVLVAGATGRTGMEVVQLLAAAGYEVRGGTRDPARAQAHHGNIATWVHLDALDLASIDNAMAGADRVVSALGGRTLRGPNSPQFIEYLAVRNLVEAARKNGIKQFVLLGAANTGPFEDHTLTPRTGYLLYWKTKGEEFLQASGLPYTIIGAGGLRDNPREGPGVRMLPRADYQWPGYVSRFRVAQVMVAALAEPDARGATFALIWDHAVAPGQISGSFKALRAPETGPRRYKMPRYRW